MSRGEKIIAAIFVTIVVAILITIPMDWMRLVGGRSRGPYRAPRAVPGATYESVWVQTGPDRYLRCEAVLSVIRCTEKDGQVE